jgi:ABC-type branched-subunit amino acid transport system substrate-binding protein
MTRALAVLVAALAVGIPAATAGQKDVPGVTPTSVLIGGTVPLTGPAAAFGVVGPGAAAYFAYVNDHGGVNGRTITYKYYDDAYDPAQTVQLTRQLVQQDNVFAVFDTIGTPSALAVQPLLNQLKVPGLFAGTGATAFSKPKQYPWTMGYLPSFSAEGAIYGRTIAATRPKARIGVLYENSDYGDDLTAGLRKGLAGKGKIVAAVGYEPTETDVASQVSRLKAAGADTFMIFATPLFAIKAFIDMHKLGWKPQVYMGSVSIEPTVMQIATASTSAATTAGANSIAFVKDPTQPRWAKDPATKLYRQIMAKYDPAGRASDVYNFYGMAVAFTMVDVLKKAGRNLTREGLLQAATHLTESNNPFLLPGIVLRTSPNDYFPMDQAALFRYIKGRWAQLGPLVPARP